MATEAQKTADPKKDTATGIQQKLIAGKYKTQDDLVDAYKALEQKLGEQGKSLAQRDAQLQQVAATAQQAAAQVQQMQPYAQWSQQYGPAIYQWIQQTQEHQRQAAWHKLQTEPQFQILTPQEKEHYFNEWQQRFRTEHLQPYVQQVIEQQARPWAEQQLAQMRNEYQAQIRAMAEVMEHSIGTIAPKEAMQTLQKNRERILKYANPRTYDPNKLAQEEMERELELIKHQSRADELERQLQAYTNRDNPAAGGNGASPFHKSETFEKSDNKYERANQIFAAVKEKVGADTFREGMPGGAA